jgi:hypothetical protein
LLICAILFYRDNLKLLYSTELELELALIITSPSSFGDVPLVLFESDVSGKAERSTGSALFPSSLLTVTGEGLSDEVCTLLAKEGEGWLRGEGFGRGG